MPCAYQSALRSWFAKKGPVMTEEDKRTMDKYGVTCETKTIYHFEGHRYDRLSDAVDYAKKTIRSAREAGHRPDAT